jgi:tetratricopeptide (TPR) repeat protein
MRRYLVDARANGEIQPLRRLNSAFRGPRVLFAYYQSGLLCQMLIEEYGFAPMVRLLEAFDRGADLDGAFREVFQRTPEEIDVAFAAEVERLCAPLAIEPRWTPQRTFQLRFRLPRKPPEDTTARAAWADDWCKVGWGSYLQGKRVDAEEALRLAGLAGDLPARGEFLRGELLLAARDGDAAAAAFRAGLARGGEDYRARMALGTLLASRGKSVDAVRQFEAAERAFPGFPDAHFSAELELARLYEQAEDVPRAMAARQRWLGWNAGEYGERVRVAEWLDSEGRHAESVVLWEEANEVDPFRRHLHLAWGQALAALDRHAEALREFRVGLEVPLDLDGDVLQGAAEEMSKEELLELAGLTAEEWDALSPEERQQRLNETLQRLAADGEPPRKRGVEQRFHAEEPLLHGHAALAAVALGRAGEARASIENALALDPDCAPALAARERLGE